MSQKLIPYGRQSIQKSDVEAVTRVLLSDWLTQGPAIEEFEKTTASYCGVQHAIAVSNATAGLHIACLALGVGPGDIVWTSPNSFVASSNCALYCGAEIDFVDIEPTHFNMSVEKLQEKLVSAKKAGRLPKIVIPVHFSGHSCEMKRIAELSKEYGFSVIEDASHALGGSYRGKKVGSCEFSDMTVFSYHPVKMITTGEGGAVLTRSSDLAHKLKQLRSHGITRETSRMEDESHGPWYYEQTSLGFNYRMTDIQAALGTSQMSCLDRFVSRRRELVANYAGALAGLPVQLPSEADGVSNSYHLYVVKLEDRIASKRRKIFESLRADGILVNVHYIPIHTQPYYRKLGFSAGMFPESERYYAGAISLPMFPDLSDKDQAFVVERLKAALERE
ncbi:MAG: UDP-4-amino-4,6-dideoxy-N-acetyl-beta-L-altrosamine transaminase [Bdellovibrionota bacterium]